MVPEVALDTAAIARAWKAAREGIVALLERKQAAPLEPIEISESLMEAIRLYEELRTQVSALSTSLQQANASVRLVKEQAAAGNVAALESDRARLKAKARHTPSTAALCAHYSEEKAAKALTATQRDQAKAGWSSTARRSSLHTRSVNDYLRRFNAGFRIESISSVTSRGGAACNYTVLITTGRSQFQVARRSPACRRSATP